MNLRHRYKITIEDESTLEQKVGTSKTLYMWVLISIVLFIAVIGLGILLLAFSPLKTNLPGYLKDSERAATEEQHLRLDSLLHVFDINEAYVSNIYNALNPVIDSTDERNEKRPSNILEGDSIMETSREEKEFMEAIRERDKFNISVTSPAAAETLMFGSVCEGSVISEETKNSYKADIIIPIGGEVATVAEGKVISIASSAKNAGGYEIIIQHPNGFLSKTGRLSNLIVQPGERVAAGQTIAFVRNESGRIPNLVTFELWHDGNRLVPSRYLRNGSGN